MAIVAVSALFGLVVVVIVIAMSVVLRWTGGLFAHVAVICVRVHVIYVNCPWRFARLGRKILVPKFVYHCKLLSIRGIGRLIS
jgi:hypothetical protein